MKIAIEKEKPPEWNPHQYTRCKESEPFLLNDRGTLIHRIRRVTIHKLFAESWFAVHTWCGASLCGVENLHFLAEPPEDRLVCAVCEERVLMAKQPSSDELAGKHVHKGRMKAFKTCCNS
jgi:hypothetical protein